MRREGQRDRNARSGGRNERCCSRERSKRRTLCAAIQELRAVLEKVAWDLGKVFELVGHCCGCDASGGREEVLGRCDESVVRLEAGGFIVQLVVGAANDSRYALDMCSFQKPQRSAAHGLGLELGRIRCSFPGLTDRFIILIPPCPSSTTVRTLYVHSHRQEVT